MRLMLLVCLLGLGSILPVAVSAIEYYVTANYSDCPDGTICHTIDEYAINSTDYFNHENVSLIFLSGKHYLTHWLEVSIMEELHLMASDTLDIPEIVTQGNKPGSRFTFFFGDIQEVLLANLLLTIENGGLDVDRVVQYREVNVTMNFVSEFDVDLSVENSNVEIISSHHSNGFTVVNESPRSENSERDITLNNCVMTNHEIRYIYNDERNEFDSNDTLSINIMASVMSGGVSEAFKLEVSAENSVPLHLESSINISDSIVSGFQISPFNGVAHATINNSTFPKGISIVGGTHDETTLNASIEQCEFSQSEEGLAITVTPSMMLQLFIINSLFEDITGVGVKIKSESVTETENLQPAMMISIHETVVTNCGTGIQLMLSKDVNWQADFGIVNTIISNNREVGIDLPDIEEGRLTISILDSELTGNQGKGLYLNTLANSNIQVTLESSAIVGTSGIGLEAYRATDSTNNEHEFLLALKNVSVSNNRGAGSQQVIVQTTGDIQTTLSDCLFEGNEGTPVRIVLGELYLNGSTRFVSNTGLKGGAVSLIFSTLHIANTNSTSVLFENNTALDIGGAVHIQTEPNSQECFYQLSGITDVNDTNAELIFYNNKATNAGEDLFGAVLNSNCTVTENNVYSSEVYTKLFKFHSSSLSSTSSDPERVCICNTDGTPQCSDIDYIFNSDTRYPGEKFNISLIVMGGDLENGAVSAAVYASLLNSDATLGDNQNRLETTCTNATYSVHSNSSEVLILFASHIAVKKYGDRSKIENAIENYENYLGIPEELLTTPVFINITITDCPVGLEKEEDTCVCEKLLKDNNIDQCTASDHNGLINRDGTQWIGNLSDKAIISWYCPFGYCKPGAISIDFNDPDAQCAEGRSGILCGQCKPDYSLMLGSSNCSDDCEDKYVSLILAFIVAGLVLVLLIMFLDLTVTVGTINGLIFYANIVWALQNIFFPVTHQYLPPGANQNSSEIHNLDGNHPLVQTLRVFIAWLNLDFGIETCFIVGLNAYGKIWLQFLFPVYIWTLCGCIVIVSWCSALAGRLLGNHPISALATLFLLSYAKLVRIVIKVLSVTYISSRDGSQAVWTEDGTVDYFRYDHAILSIVCILMVILLWMPYLLSLLFIQPLKKISHPRLIRLVNKWKTFFGTYVGCLQSKYEYWVGLLLLVRAILFVIIIIVSPLEPNLTLFFTVVITAAIGFHPFVYKNWLLTITEKSYLFNLTILACGTLYANYVDDTDLKFVIVCILTGIAFFEFVAIIVFHVILVIRRFLKWKRHNTWSGQPVIRISSQRDLRTDDDESCREPLLNSHSLKQQNYN